MPIKFYNPTSPGRRAGSVLDYNAVITRNKPEKSLTVGKLRANGRNHHGVITAKHRGGGNKPLYPLAAPEGDTNGWSGGTGAPAAVKPQGAAPLRLIHY